MSFDVEAIRSQFPILQRRVPTRHGDKPLVYLDHGASTHAPRRVIDAVSNLMESSYANIHRGNHTLSLESSDLFDQAQETIAEFVGTNTEDSVVVFCQNTTMALDMVAHVASQLPGATLTTLMEHHSNDLPHRNRGEVIHAGVDDWGRLDYDDVQAKLSAGGVKLLAVTGASNVTGFLPDLPRLARMAHAVGAKILVDAAQLYAHKAIDVKKFGHPEHIDFLAVGAHKCYAPFGSAVLIADRHVMDAVPPYMPGGGTVQWVTPDSAMWAKGADRHMGGTPNIPGAIAFAEATRFLDDIGMDKVRAHELELIRHGIKRFEELEPLGIHLMGPRNPEEKGAVFSVVPGDLSHDDVSRTLDQEWGIATRNGCFCAHPLLHKMLGLGDTSKWTDALSRGESIDLPGAVRGAVGIYNTKAELDAYIDGLEAIVRGRVPLASGEVAAIEVS